MKRQPNQTELENIFPAKIINSKGGETKNQKEWAYEKYNLEYNEYYDLVHIETYGGGEGEGEEFWMVFAVEDKKTKGRVSYWKWDGYYASYDGGYLTDLFEVEPREVVVTQYERKK